MITVKVDNEVSFIGSSAYPGARDDIYVLDHILIHNFSEIIKDGILLPLQLGDSTFVGNILRNEFPRANTVAGKCQVDLSKRIHTKNILAVIQYFTTPLENEFNVNEYNFISRYHEDQVHIKDHQILLADLPIPHPGMFAHTP